VEAAIKIARFYTGKQKIISRYRSYHGATAGSISVTGDPRRLPAEPGVPGTIKAPDPYAYGSTLEPMESLEYIDEMLELEGDTVAAVLVEPIVGSNGILVPPEEYLPELKRIAHDHGALLICDEVMSGFGRTGEWFGSDVFDVTPDIMTMAKGLSGAYAPLGATIVTPEIADHFEDEMFCHGHTYAGHPVACAAGLAAVETYEEENLIERASEVGDVLSASDSRNSPRIIRASARRAASAFPRSRTHPVDRRTRSVREASGQDLDGHDGRGRSGSPRPRSRRLRREHDQHAHHRAAAGTDGSRPRSRYRSVRRRARALGRPDGGLNG